MKSRTRKALQLALATGCLLGLEVEARELVYSTYLGGSGTERAEDIAVDTAGNAWVMGTTASANFPTTANALDRTLGGQDVFLAKFGPGGALLYSTFLGGLGTEVGHGIALDAAGNVYVTGHTDSSDFPRVGGLPASLRGTGAEIFVVKLSPSGSNLLYSTTFGGSGLDRAWRIAVDAAGAAYVAGETDSRDFPVIGGVQTSFGGGDLDAFVAKLSPGGTALSYSTYLGGSSYDVGRSLAVDEAGRAAVGGTTLSLDFPVDDAEWSSFQGGGTDAFVTILEASGSSFVSSTYLGGSGNEATFGLAFEPEGSLYAAGATTSPDFPLEEPLQGYGGDSDAFVSRLNRSGSLLFSTYLGGSSSDFVLDIALGRSGRIALGGTTTSRDFPVEDPLQSGCIQGPVPSSSNEVFAAELNPGGSELLFSTYLCGSALDLASGVAVDPRGNLYLAGETSSPNFPVVNAFQPTRGGGLDAFVAKISPDNLAPDCSGATASPAILWPPNGKLVPISIRGVTDPEGGRATITITGIRQDEPLSRAGTPDATGIGTATARVRADRKGGGDGRVYHLSFTATDLEGASCNGAVTVCVPHDRRPGATCGDGGALFDSVRP